MTTVAIVIMGTACFLVGLLSRRMLSHPHDADEIEAVIRRHLALQIRQYAGLADKVQMAGVMRIIEGKSR